MSDKKDTKKNQDSMFRDTEITISGEKIYISPTLKLIFAWTIFFALLFVFILVVRDDSKKDDKKTDSTTQENVSDTSVTNDDEIGSTDAKATNVDGGSTTVPMEVNAYPEVNALVNSYLTATVSCDAAILKSIVTNPAEFDDMTALQARAQFIQGYTNVQCYTKTGPETDSFVVFVVSNTTIANIATAPMDFMTLYVQKTENGYVINNNTLTDDITGYINSVKQDSDIQQVMQEVANYNTQAVESDADLKAFYEMLGQ